jgi:hypothetical protein
VLSRKLVFLFSAMAGLAPLPARPAKPPLPGVPASLMIRDNGSWTFRLAPARPVKGGIGIENGDAQGGQRPLLANPLDGREIQPNTLNTVEFIPPSRHGAFGFDVELIAGPDSLYRGAKLVFHVQGIREVPGLKTSNEHWVAAGTNGTPHVTWGLRLAREKEDLPSLLEFN